MAVSLTSTLLSHQRSASRRPDLAVVAEARAFGVARFPWRRLWRDNGADYPSAMAIAADGSLTRVRNAAGTLEVQRFTAPSSTANNWGAWTTGFATATSGSQVAIAALGTEVVVVYVRSNTLYQRVSSDSGATFAAEAAIVTEASAPSFPALAYRASTGNLCLFHALSNAVRRIRRTSGTWAGTSTAWTNSVATVTGIAAVHDGADFALLVSGTEVTTTHKRVWSCQMGDGGLPSNAWSSLVTVAESDSGSTTTFHTPSLLYDSGIGAYWGTFAAREAGAVAVDRVLWTHTAAGATPLTTWLEPAPHEAVSDFGLRLAFDGADEAYGCTGNHVYRAAIAAAQTLTSQLVSAHVRFAPTSTAGELVFDDRDGALAAGVQLAQASPDTPPPALAPGHQLTLTPGYLTSAGVEAGVLWRLHVDAVETRYDRDGRRLALVRVSGPWEAVAAWSAPQARQVASGTRTRAQLFQEAAGRAGVPVSTGSEPWATSTAWSAYSPSFVVAAGESGAAVLRRLLAPVADVAAGDAADGGFRLRSWHDPRWSAVMKRLEPAFWFRLHEAANTPRAVEEVAGQNLSLYDAAGTGAPDPGVAGPLATQPTGAYDFNGAADDVLTDHATMAWHTGTTNWTLLALCKPASLPAGGTRAIVAYNGLTVAPTGRGFAVCLLPNGHLGYLAEYVALVDMGGNIPLAAWSFVALTRDTTTCRGYVDGVDTGVTSTAAPTASPNTFTIGAQWAGAAYDFGFDGDISEVALFTRPLTPTELLHLEEGRDPAQWEFGASAHPITRSLAGARSPEVNWTRLVDGAGTRYADAFEAQSVYDAGPRRATLRVLDATTDQRAEDYAAGALATDYDDLEAELVVPWHAGLQLGDVIRIGGIVVDASSLWRVSRLALRYERGARYDAELRLAAL